MSNTEKHRKYRPRMETSIPFPSTLVVLHCCRLFVDEFAVST